MKLKNLLLVLILNSTLCIFNSSAQTLAIAAGYDYSIFICNDSTVWAVGYNNNGKLGDNTITAKSTPGKVHGPGNVGFLKGIKAISAGSDNALALKSDSTVWAWGKNNKGQLGDSSITDKYTPVKVHGPGNVKSLTGIIAISASYYEHCLALKSDGTVWAWGENGGNELGDNTTTDRRIPVQVHGFNNVGFLTGIIAIAAGEYHSVALKNDGTVWAWGNGSNGALGNGFNNYSATPVQMTGLTGVIAIAAGYGNSLALKSDGTVWACGYNSYGQLGNGITGGSSNVPIQVHGPGNVGFLTGMTAIAEKYTHCFAIKNDGTVWGWGYNGSGVLGDNTTTDRNAPVQVHGTGNVGFLTGITAIAPGDYHTLTLKNNATGWAWGANGDGEFVDGAGGSSYTPVQMTLLSVCGASGIDEPEIKNAISVYPNPSNGKFQIAVNDQQSSADNIQAEIYNLLGESIFHSSINHQTIIDISNHPKGVYFVKVAHADGTQMVQKIVYQ